MRKLIWFSDSPDEGTMECICSWCAEVIKEDAFRVWNYRGQEVRFHQTCTPGIWYIFSHFNMDKYEGGKH